MNDITLENLPITTIDKEYNNVIEEWRKIPKFDRYQVSNLGRLKLASGCISNRKSNCSYYVNLGLINNKGIRKTISLHVLIARTFIPNPEHKRCVGHINGIKNDNKVTNLEWCTHKENNNRKVFPNDTGRPRKLVQYDETGEILLKVWDSLTEAAQEENININGISNACKVDKGLYKNYRWKYYFEELDGEEWKELKIDGIIIRLSSLGRISTKTGYVSFGSTSNCGYKNTQIGKNHFQVHRLVCMAFKPIEGFEYHEDYKEIVIDHIDNIKTNNNINNLEWCTQKENVIRSMKYRKNKNNNTRRVNQLNEEGEVIVTFASIKEATAAIGSSRSHISSVCGGKRNYCGGYKWKYADL